VKTWIPSEPQTLALKHLRNDRAALFMGCGLGKTSVVLHRLAELFSDGATDGALVVAPLRVCNLTWPSEIAKWAGLRGLTVTNLRTPQGQAQLARRKGDIYLCNYEALPKLRDSAFRNKRVGFLGFDTVIWDESTKAKNHKSMRVNSVKPLFHKHCKRHWGMTGTPSPNGLLDLFAQVRLLDGGDRLGKSYQTYKEAYFKPLDYNGYNWVPKDGARERIYQKLKGFALTLKSSDWLDIPDTVEEDVELNLSKGTKDRYEELERELLLEMELGTIVANNAAVLVNKLLQLSSGAIYSQEEVPGEEKLQTVVHHIHDSKVMRLAQMCASLAKSRKPVLIGVQFRHEQERIMKAVPGAVRFDQATTERAQQVLIDKWNRRQIPALIANPASMAHGLNLQEGGSNIIWFTMPWSRELYDQFNARLARTGQEEITTVQRLVMAGTMDEVVLEALRGKEEEQTALLDALRVWREHKLVIG
jgi:SNF2 family DNA or RNA helicase